MTIVITKKKFMDFETCRSSGVTNMADRLAVSILTGLSRDEVSEIQKNYVALRERYLPTPKKDGDKK